VQSPRIKAIEPTAGSEINVDHALVHLKTAANAMELVLASWLQENAPSLDLPGMTVSQQIR
jgi:hypothetical protein